MLCSVLCSVALPHLHPTWNTRCGASPGAAPGSAHSGTSTKAVSLAGVWLVTVTERYSDALRREQLPKSSASLSTVSAAAGSWPPNSSDQPSGPSSLDAAPSPPSAASPSGGNRLPKPPPANSGPAPPSLAPSSPPAPVAAEGGLESSCDSSTAGPPDSTRAM